MPNIKLKGQNGENLTFNDVERVYFDSADQEGEVVHYTHGKVMEDVTIEPDFANGDQVFSVPDGSLVKEATIVKPATLVPENIRAGTNVAGVVGEYVTPGTTKEIEPDFSEGNQTVTAEGDERWNEVVFKKPETLIPENIAKDIDIAGIIGTFAGGGAVKIATGTITGALSGTNVSHGLGVVPDIIFFAGPQSASSTNSTLIYCFSVSSAFAKKMGVEGYLVSYTKSSGGAFARTVDNSASAAIDVSTDGLVRLADESTFYVGSLYFRVRDDSIWLAIAGLT